jgi:hypothetical protein
LRKATTSFVVCPSVRMEQIGSHRTDFHENLIFEGFSKICQIYINRTIIKGTLLEDHYTYLSYPAYLFLEWEMFQTKVVDKIKTHIVCSVIFFFFRKSCRLWERGKIMYSEAHHRLDAAWAFHVGYLTLQKHTQVVYYSFFFNATMVALMRLNVTLYLHCLSCLYYPLSHFFITLLYPLLKHKHFYLFLKISMSCGLSLTV